MVSEWRKVTLEARNTTSRFDYFLWTDTSTWQVVACAWFGLQSKHRPFWDRECSCHTLQWKHEALAGISYDKVSWILDQVYQVQSSLPSPMQVKWMKLFLKHSKTSNEGSESLLLESYAAISRWNTFVGSHIRLRSWGMSLTCFTMPLFPLYLFIIHSIHSHSRTLWYKIWYSFPCLTCKSINCILLLAKLELD